MKMLKVNMSRDEIIVETFPKDKILGGRALTSYLMTEYGSPTDHALSEQNCLIVAPGLLAGTSAPQSGRISLGVKSPLTGGIKESNSGGTVAHLLGRLGIQGIVVEGKAKEWQVMRITADGAELEPAGDIVGMDNYAACERLRKRYGEEIGIMVTGRAGEMKMANSTVAVTDPEGRPSRQCGRGGPGAVMGAKGLKAIVVDSKGGSLRKPADDSFKAAIKEATEAIKNGDATEMIHKMGSAAFIQLEHDRGSLPSYNHSQGSFDKVENLTAEKMVQLVEARGGTMGHGCMPGCVVCCSPIYHDADGNFLTAAFEYETLGMLGANLGIDDMDAIARMDRRCDELGFDTIETGSAIGVLHEAGLFEFGDTSRAEALIEEMGKGTPLGRILGTGVTGTAKAFGIARVPAVKGQAIPAHSARSSKGWAVTYATTAMGADHTAGIVMDEPLSTEGQVERSRGAQIYSAAQDATGLCLYTFLSPELTVPMINSFYGINWSVEDYLEMGKEILRQERTFNINAGIGKEADRLPDWLRKYPLPPTNAVFDVAQKEIDGIFNF